MLITRFVVGLWLYVALIDCVVVLVVCVVFVCLGLVAWFLGFDLHMFGLEFVLLLV